ncbi:hypothetical protein MSKU15_0940 [Komagataeibacter diospyri]|uniref:hypothetical protein n=1 Tax=Komagataeibacter diospyri TaxID=1932662 RepID=UPI001139E0B1|nr:hypothetical protein [Komagataeibacter diospyri]GCE89339.1 hypothetical protein MSKU15_0940 [Komagataeibacter diospyri]
MNISPKTFKRQNREIFIYYIVIILISPTMAMAADRYPPDVTTFLHDAEICQYLGGEWDSTLPDDRKKDLTEEIGSRCDTIYEKQKSLRNKYSHDKNILSIINVYDFGN